MYLSKGKKKKYHMIGHLKVTLVDVIMKNACAGKQTQKKRHTDIPVLICLTSSVCP